MEAEREETAPARPPETALGFAALTWSMGEGAELDGVALAVNGCEAESLPADYLELYYLLRALCMADAGGRAEYRLIVKAALQRLPQKARAGMAAQGEIPWWLKD